MTKTVNNIGQKITVFATFLAFMGMGVVDPILPEIAGKMGAANWQVEMLFTSYVLMMAMMMIPAGILASRFGDKKVMTFGLALVSLFAFACSMAGDISSLALFRAGWGFGNANFFATALILLILLSKDRNQAVALFEGAIGFGIACGPLVGGFVGHYSWHYPFMVTGVLAFSAFLLVLFFVKVPKEKQKSKPPHLSDLAKLIRDRGFLHISLAAMFYYYGFFVVLAYSPLVIHFGAIEIGLVFFGWGVGVAIGSIVLSTRLEHHFRVGKMLPWTLGSFVLILIAMTLAESKQVMTALIILSGLLSGLNNSFFTTHVMGVKFEKNIVSGGFNFLRWMGAAAAPVASGIFSEHLGMKVPFMVATILVCAAIATLLLAPHQHHARAVH